MKKFSPSVWMSVLSSMILPLAVADDASPRPMVIAMCDVALADTPLDVRPAVEFLRLGAGDEVEAFPQMDGQEWIEPMRSIGHPFLAAAHRAFADHRPLALSPDMIWQLLVQMAAEEVHAAPEKHRMLFTDHAHGSRTLEVSRDEFTLGGDHNDWPGVFSELEQSIVAKVPESPALDFTHAFSTTTATDLAARQVVLLKAASPYYNYQVGTLCGIPRIELHGTADDWRWIREKAAGLRQFNMERRVNALMPILDEFVAASEGKATPTFWKSYYKYDAESGSSYVSGWINVFFVQEDDKLLDVVLDPEFSWLAPPTQKTSHGALNLPLAISLRSYPSQGVVDVDFVWLYFEQTIPMRWRAGFMGVAQDPESMTLKPVMAWQVLRVKLDSEERMAADYLSNLRHLDRFTLRAIERGLALDPETGLIRDVRPGRGGPINVNFWIKALPMMSRLEAVNMRELLGFQDGDPDKRKAICEAMLSAASLKLMIVPKNLDEASLRILEDRTDWMIEVEE